MSLWNRPLAALVALPLLAGQGPSQSSTPPASASPSSLVDPISGIRPKLEKAINRINALSAPLGLAGWPGLRGSEAVNLPNASLEDRVFRNNRVLVLGGRSTNAYSALVLMQEVPAGQEVYYHLVVIKDLFGEPTVQKAQGEVSRTYADAECLWFEGGNVHSGDAEDMLRWPKPGLRILPDSTTKFALAEEGTDNFGCLLYSPGKPISTLVDYLLNDHNEPENKNAQDGDAFGNFIKRSDFNRANKTAEDNQYIWFLVDDETYAVDKKDWVLWRKGPQSYSQISTP